MIAPHQVSKFAGLFDSSNPYKVAPEGAASIADNCVVRSVDTLSPRPGYAAVAVGATADAIGFKEGSALALTWDDTTRGVTGKLQVVNLSTGVRSTVPMKPGGFPFNAPGGSGFTRFVSANKSLYFQSRYGLTKIERVSSGVCRAALQPCGWSGTTTAGTILATATPAGIGVNDWLANGSQVAYRYTICRLGANAELIESEPSERFICANTSGATRSVQVVTEPSYMIPSDAFMRIYRTKQVATSADPGDEMYLVAESVGAFLIGADGYRELGPTSGGINYIDQTPDTSLTVPLYTNPISGGGIASQNTPAPIAADMAYFKNRLLLLNTRDVERLTIKVLGTGTGGIVDGDSITVAGTKYTFRSNPQPNTTDVGLFTSGTVAQNIEKTARALQTAISFPRGALTLSALNPQVVFARYVSVGASDAGQVLLQRIVPGADPIIIQTSSSNGWDADYTTPTKSDPNAQSAGLSWSAIDQPEGVPLENSAIVGDASSPGQRIVPLKEACLIFKQGDGLFRWTDDGSGDNSGVAITVADPTVRLLAPETAQPLDNFVFALCDQGVLAFSEQGQHVDVSFEQIGKELQKLVAYVGLSTLAATAFAVVNQQEHEYILCLPESPGATSCTLQYVFNEKTKVWTRWTLPGVVSGAVDPVSGKVVWGFSAASTGPGAANALWIERKNSDSTDFQDPGFTIACPISTATATMVFAGDLTSGVNAIAVGDTVEQAQTVQFLRKRVKAVSYASGAAQTTVTLDSAPATAWSTGQALTVRKAIQAVVKFLPWSAGEPLTEKKWSSIYFVYRTLDIDWITYQWASENLSTPAATEQVVGVSTGTEPLPPILLDLFASSAWGSPAWDRQTQNVVIRTTLPKEVASCALLGLQLTLACSLEQWALCVIDAKLTEALPEPTR